MKKFFIPLAFIFGFLVIFPKFAFGDLIIPLSNEEKVIEGLHRDVTNTKGLYRDGHNKEIQSSHSSDELYQKIVKNQKEQLRVENEKLRVKQNQLKRKEKIKNIISSIIFVLGIIALISIFIKEIFKKFRK